MSTAIDLAVILFGLLASAAYSGSEIAFYSVSRARIDVEARPTRVSHPHAQQLLLEGDEHNRATGVRHRVAEHIEG